MRPTSNPAFWRALHSLAHPVSLAAVLLLLFNDHWLRWHYPSWLTGKLGDFTWLVFAPFIAGATLAWVVRRGKNNERLVGLLAFAFIGLWFALAKTVPAVHGLTVQAWEAVIDWRGTLRMDATDLLTLPALLLGWWVWRRVGNTPLNLRPLAWAALGLGVVGTLASTDPMYTSYGIDNICETTDGTLVVSAFDGTSRSPLPEDNRQYVSWTLIFESDDGGASWRDLGSISSHSSLYQLPTMVQCASYSPLVISQSNVQFRWDDKIIERSTNDGNSWTTLFRFNVNPQVRDAVHKRTSGTINRIVEYYPGPRSALWHSKSDNVVFNMGWDGVLVFKSDGSTQWVSVGEFQAPNWLDIDALDIEWLGGLMLFTLTIVTTHARVSGAKRLSTIMTILWCGWLGFGLLYLPYRYDSGGVYGFVTEVSLAMIVVDFIGLIILLPTCLYSVFRLRRRKIIKTVTFVAVALVGLYLLPFILWLKGTVPVYSTAVYFSVLTSTTGILAAYRYLKNKLPVLPKPEVKPRVGEAEPAPGN